MFPTTTLILNKVIYNGIELKSTPAVSIEITFDSTKQELLATNKKLGISIYATNQRELVDTVYRQIIFMWQECALSPDDRLTEDFRKLKETLRTNFQQISQVVKEWEEGCAIT